MDLQPFKFQQSSIRVIEKDGEPWFVAKDVVDALGYYLEDAIIIIIR